MYTSKGKLLAENKGFTIVELLVVIVVIGILAAITIVAYTGITQKAQAASLESDLINAKKQLQLFQVENEGYPQAIDDCPSPAAENICIDASDDNIFDYEYNNSSSPQTFSLVATNGSLSYIVTDSTTPSELIALVCPTGFIVVPGSSTYGTSDFCVMKYEAKNVGDVPTSQATGLPWENISQDAAITAASNACEGCHLITEAEWLTIAQNVLGVDSNWSGGSVGSGYIFSGHNDGTPDMRLEASANDNDGYVNTSNVTGNQRRTLELSNGEVIWDLAGNVWEWTSGKTTGGQPGMTGEPDYAYKEWNAVSEPGSLAVNADPAFGTPAASSWDSNNGLGRLLSYVGETQEKGFLRGGVWHNNVLTGIFTLFMDRSPSSSDADFGFRVAK